jgi:hypothetical protein
VPLVDCRPGHVARIEERARIPHHLGKQTQCCSPFANYFVPGAVLFTIIGLGPLGAAVLAWRRHPGAPLLAVVAGAELPGSAPG